MTNFESFLNKKEENYDDYEEMIGTYGCKECELYVSKAFFNPVELTITYFCANRHKSVIEIV